jgi:hypothetical protein
MKAEVHGCVRGDALLVCKSFTSKKILMPKAMNKRQALAEATLYALHLTRSIHNNQKQ